MHRRFIQKISWSLIFFFGAPNFGIATEPDEIISEEITTPEWNGTIAIVVVDRHRIPLNEMFQLHIKLKPREAHTKTPVDLTVDAQMPEHKHGMIVVAQTKKISDRKFIVSGMKLHMP